jgi:hypothetical protein
VAATVVASAAATSSGRTAIAYANVPTGTTGTIDFTLDASGSRAGIGWWRLTGASIVPHDTDAKSSDTTPNIAIDTFPGGVVIANACGDSAGSGTITGATERYDTQIEANSVHIGGDASFTTATANFAIDFAFNAGATACASAISFRPG